MLSRNALRRNLIAGLRAWPRFALLIVVLLTFSGCAGRLNKAARSYYSGQPQDALAILNKGDNLGQRNELLFLMEQGVVLHQLGQYRDSAQKLLAAAELIAQFDMISVSEQAGSLVTTEWLTRYKGEYSERLWVHTYLMMDFLLLGDYDSALVEAKRALQVLDRHRDSLKEAYFTRALIALCFANVGEDNGAFLEYRRLAEDLSDPTPVALDLVRYASRLGMPDQVEKYQPYIMTEPSAAEAELVLFVANGRIPAKQPGNVILPPSIRFSFPYYRAGSTPLYPLQVLPPGTAQLPVVSTDMTRVAKAALEERKVQIIVRETARAAAKEAISQSVGRNQGQVAEVALRIGLLLLEEPDVRHWQTLPGRLALLRIPLRPGTHYLRLKFAGARPQNMEEYLDLPPFEIRNGQRLFKSIRF